jgi:O-methyltransferase
MSSTFSVRAVAKHLLAPMRSLGHRFVHDPAWVNRDAMVYKAGFVMAADNVEGDYLEFGVLAGNSFIKAYRSMYAAFRELTSPTDENNVTSEDLAARVATWNRRRFFAFDSFEGLPEVTGLDKHGSEFKRGKYLSSLDKFMNNVRRAGVPPERTVCVKGWFKDTLTQETIQKHNLARAAVVYIDSDLYESARLALNFIKPLLVDGTIIMFDEWFGFRGNPELGERRAFSEFVEQMPDWVFTEFQKEGPRRSSFIANKRLAATGGVQ